MTREKILEYLKDINHVYNDCTRYDTLKHMIDELQQPCEDAVSRAAVEDAIANMNVNGESLGYAVAHYMLCDLPSVNPQQKTGWIPVKWHYITDEEREREGYPKEWVNHIDCVMPEDGEEILITVRGRVEKDICYIDDGFYLDSGYDWVEDIEAWCELPQPYEPQESEG